MRTPRGARIRNMTEPAPLRSGFVEPEGRPIYWELFGAGGREIVCLLNGVAMSTRAWHPFLPRLLDEYDVLLFDYWGQGNSFSEDVPYSIPSFCHGLRMILDELGARRIHLMGISYGGFVALDFARLYPHRLHTLALSGILLTHEMLFEMYEELSLMFYRAGQMELYAFYLYEKIFGETFVRAIGPRLEQMRGRLVERYRDKAHCLTRLTLAQDALFAALDANLPAYRSIDVPALLIAGEQDRVIAPRVQQKICGILRRARFELVPDCGHVVYLEKPDLFFGMLKQFFSVKSAGFESAR
jgi:pimeloyl-ACP methyl ester carboxylesterase